MWLPDVNVPMDVTALLRKQGVVSSHASQPGWGSLKNGQVVEAAVGRGVRCLLTRDRLLGESAAKALQRNPELGVVLVTNKQVKGPEFLRLLRQAWDRVPTSPVAGSLLRWPGDQPVGIEPPSGNES